MVDPMLWLLIVVAVFALGYLAQHFGWIDLSNKRKTSNGGGVMGIGDEVFNPTKHEAQVEMDRQTVLPAPAPVAGDGDKGVYRGSVRIDLPSEDTDPLPRRRR
jgi:hypothetical protein